MKGRALRRYMSVRAELEEGLCGIPGVHRRPSRYGDGYSYFVSEREIAHFHGDGRLDVRLTREEIRRRKEDHEFDDRVTTRGPSADWIAVRVSEARDRSLALSLVEVAVRANS